MGTSLYDHQKKALEKMKVGSVLCGGVGSGKSRTALAFFIKHICEGSLSKSGKSAETTIKRKVPLYIITIAKKRDNKEWEQECSYFLLSTQEPTLTEVHIDSWNNIGKYVDVENAFFIFDEQRIGGTGKWAQTFVKISRKNQWILLSATPGDTWMDYWAIFVANGHYRNVTDFRRQHVVYKRIQKFLMIDHYVGTRKLERLRSEILIPMHFERKATRHHIFKKVRYDEASYLKASKKRWNVFEERPIENISEACYVFRKVVNTDPSRCVCVMNILKNHPKAIIFYNYDYELEQLKACFDENGYSYSEWNGHRHQEIPRRSEWAYLVQYNAGAEGWNCIETDTVIFFSQTYSFKTLEQSCGRIDRLNTPYTDLFYFHIFSDAPIDLAIKKCLKGKKTFNEKAFVEKCDSREKQPL